MNKPIEQRRHGSPKAWNFMHRRLQNFSNWQEFHRTTAYNKNKISLQNYSPNRTKLPHTPRKKIPIELVRDSSQFPRTQQTTQYSSFRPRRAGMCWNQIDREGKKSLVPQWSPREIRIDKPPRDS